jgi:hypothetical protein
MAAFKRVVLAKGAATPVAFAAQPVSARDLKVVALMLADIAPQWSVELHGISLEDSSLVVLPEDGEDENGPSFAISRDGYSLRLDQIHWDELTELGSFATLGEVLDVMARTLGEFTDFHRPRSITLH